MNSKEASLQTYVAVDQKAGWKQFAERRSAPAPVYTAAVGVFLCVQAHVLHVSNTIAQISFTN